HSVASAIMVATERDPPEVAYPHLEGRTPLRPPSWSRRSATFQICQDGLQIDDEQLAFRWD
ncbi:MAG: hypothetical protein RMM08_13690, partial [Armatimonadota bacterium]|nr:hypothetical protein [Armatimonadota bacterium]